MKLKDIKAAAKNNFCDTRKEFVDTFLGEMPGMAGDLDLYPSLLNIINDLQSNGVNSNKISENLFKIVSHDVAYYWAEQLKVPVLIIEIRIKPDAYYVSMTGKKSEAFGKPPYASDLYEAILKDSKHSLLFSDEYLSDKSFDIWARLLKDGKKISVYDTKEMKPIRISSPEDLKQFYHSTGKRFRFTLSENHLMDGAIMAKFNLYRTRKENNIL